MHRLIRNTHLALGIAFTLVWLMYGLSSVQMSHPEWFPMEPAVTREIVAAGPVSAASPEVLAASLAREIGARGDVENIRAAGDTVAFRVVRPGTVLEVTYLQEEATALVVTRVGGFMTMLNRLHHYAGFWRGWLPLDLWGLLVAAASVGLILLGVTGIYLWFRTHGERVVGGAILLGGGVASVVLLVLMRAAG